MKIRKAKEKDWDRIWPIFKEIVSQGETYGFDVDTTYEQGRALWLDSPRETYVLEEDREILGSYFIRTNQGGPGSHVCNCGYMVSSNARGKGLATLMCQHSQEVAVNLNYKAMQFNFVASSNEAAVHLWKKLGFEQVGRMPRAFKHPKFGYVDALLMFKWLV